MRSVVVVFPASMCAMIPMFRMRARGTSRITGTPLPRISFGSAAISLYLSLSPLAAGRRAFLRGGRRWSPPPDACGRTPRVADRGDRAPKGPAVDPEAACPRRPTNGGLPAVVRERPVRLGHLLHVVLALDRGADAVAGVHQLGGQPLGHRLLAALAGVPDDPADRERRRPAGPHLDRDLVRGPADAPALDLERRPDVLDRPLDRPHRLGARLALDLPQRVVHDALGQ